MRRRHCRRGARSTLPSQNQGGGGNTPSIQPISGPRSSGSTSSLMSFFSKKSALSLGAGIELSSSFSLPSSEVAPRHQLQLAGRARRRRHGYHLCPLLHEGSRVLCRGGRLLE